MGSLASRPRAPQVQPIAIQQAAPPSVPQAIDAAEPASSDAQIASQVRSDDLLRRRRGRAGTVLTGFRGLSPTDDTSAADASRAGRNLLLGE